MIQTIRPAASHSEAIIVNRQDSQQGKCASGDGAVSELNVGWAGWGQGKPAHPNRAGFPRPHQPTGPESPVPTSPWGISAVEMEYRRKIREHKAWLASFPHECPSPYSHYRIGVYIRYFNQTKYENYLDYHKQEFADTIALCPNWTLVDFYIDEGQTAPNMENCPGWTRLLEDCFAGKVDLIVTQKTTNVSRKPRDLALISRILASQHNPVGIYFISEDLFTLASYYIKDMKDKSFFPAPDWEILPEETETNAETSGISSLPAKQMGRGTVRNRTRTADASVSRTARDMDSGPDSSVPSGPWATGDSGPEGTEGRQGQWATGDSGPESPVPTGP